jgi:phage antirepressor YoqD-like protein
MNLFMGVCQGLSGTKLNRILNFHGIQYFKGGQWVLYQKHVNEGWCASQTTYDKFGNPHMITKWSQKGRLMIHDLLGRQGIYPVSENLGVA